MSRNESVPPARKALIWAERTASFVLVLVLYVLLATGAISTPLQTGYVSLLLALALTFYFVGRLAYLGYAYIHERKQQLGPLRSIESGVLAIAFLYLQVTITGGPTSPFVPLVYLAMAVLCTIHTRKAALIYLALALLFEVTVPLFTDLLMQNLAVIVSHVFFLLLFASLSRVLTRFGGGAATEKARQQVAYMLGDIEREARHFRQLGIESLGQSNPESERRHDLSAYFEIHDVLQDLLRFLGISHEAHTAVALWYDAKRNTLRVVEAYTASSRTINHDEFDAGSGVLHGVLTSTVPVRLTCSEWTRNQIGYYRTQQDLYAFCGVPIRHDDKLLGVLAVDRQVEREFSETEAETIRIGSQQIRRAMINENILRGLEKSQNEYFHLAAASKALSKTLDAADVLKVALKTTHDIAPYDMGTIVMVGQSEQEYEVVASWPENNGLLGVTFDAGNNLINWVVRKNQTLVYQDFNSLPRRPTIFTREEKLAEVASLLIVPLNVAAQTVGALALISSEQDFFTTDLRHIYEILSNQIAVSMENAQNYQKVERMAITDGLTNLYNKRHFQQRIDELLSRAERHDDAMSLLMMDIDHFKRVNDTYGHPVGDLVLKQVARTLRESMRKIDLVARYGGEEFVVLLDATGESAAVAKGEELREKVSELVFDTEMGEFQVSISIGIALFPYDSRNEDELLEKADSALYHSKRTGRNRVTVFSRM